MQTVNENSSSRGSGVRRAQADANLARQARNWASRSTAVGADARSAPGLDESSFLSSKAVLASPGETRGKPDRSKAYRSRGWFVRIDEMMILTAVIVPFKISVPTAMDASLM